jgi:hypothetical protein
MDLKTYDEYYIKPISLDRTNAPLPQIFKDQSVLKILPEENISANRKTYTFINKNLDIITVPHDAYLYFRTTNNTESDDVAKAKALNTISIPTTAGLIDGFDYMINDNTICTQNNSLASTLYAVNNGLYASSSKSLEHLGLSDPSKSPFNLQSQKVGTDTCEWVVPLKLFIPFLKDNKILWGVKQTLKITLSTFKDILYKIADPSSALHASDNITINGLELRMPYVKLENEKQLALWNSMYSNTIERYWLDVDQFWSSPVSNKVSQSNATFRVATKGLHSKPRYLLLHAVDDDGNAYDRHRPMGFNTGYGTVSFDKDKNSIRFKKLRIKLNGIYIDNGDVMEFFCADAGTNPYTAHREYHRAYDEYSKFFGQYYSKDASVKSFNEWLAEQLYVFDLNNIDNEAIFQNAGNALIIEIEYSTYSGTDASTKNTFKLVANVLYDKQLVINHNENKAVITVS